MKQRTLQICELADPETRDGIRAGTYRLLAMLLGKPPSAPILTYLRERDEPESADGSLAAGWRALKQASDDADLETLEDEFHALFIGLGCGELVPYGSWYQTGALMGTQLAMLRRDLSALGIERQPGVSEPEDHAAALCETMALIISSDSEISIGSQKVFFQDHFGPWMGSFFRDMQEAKAAHFYRTVGRFGAAFIKTEERYLVEPYG
ncbi:MAG: TorD/DmsD family molecular chaperone [Gammaproteobacteria bacterium]